jgi:hypothetical protein
VRAHRESSAHPEIDDAQRLRIFRQFLRETPSECALLHDLAHAPEYFADRLRFEAWRNRWLAYLVGLADGPTSKAEYAALRPKLYGHRRPETDVIDRFHS